MERTEITLNSTLSIWWSFMWRALVVGVLCGFVLGFIGGFMLAIAGRGELSATVGAILGWLGSIPVSIWALKAALAKQHGGYSIALMKPS